MWSCNVTAIIVEYVVYDCPDSDPIATTKLHVLRNTHTQISDGNPSPPPSDKPTFFVQF